MSKKRYHVQVPYSGYRVVTVSKDISGLRQDEAQECLFNSAMEALGGMTDSEVRGLDGEMNYHIRMSRGNVLSAVLHEVDWCEE